MRPHQSFDLNGDGGISSKEFFIAKKFDQDRDGKLNSHEKKICMEALLNGFEKKIPRKDANLIKNSKDPAV